MVSNIFVLFSTIKTKPKIKCEWMKRIVRCAAKQNSNYLFLQIKESWKKYITLIVLFLDDRCGSLLLFLLFYCVIKFAFFLEYKLLSCRKKWNFVLYFILSGRVCVSILLPIKIECIRLNIYMVQFFRKYGKGKPRKEFFLIEKYDRHYN